MIDEDFGKPYEGELHVRIDEEMLVEIISKPAFYSTSALTRTNILYYVDEQTFNALREIGEYSGKFYNMVNYDFRNGNFMNFYDMYDHYKDHIRCKYLQAYEVKEKPKEKTRDIMSIDLGVKNLAAITFMHQKHQYLIDGNVLKSQIATYNKWLKEAVSKEMKRTGSKHFKITKKIRKKHQRKKNYIKSCIHRASRKIVDIAIDSDAKTIVIGDFKHIKNKNKIKYFVEIPHSRLKEQITYKAKLEGIEVVFINEAYTSIDLERVNKGNANKKRRISRGLFKTSKRLINSDINGSLNILRKYDDYKNIPMLIKQVRDKG